MIPGFMVSDDGFVGLRCKSLALSVEAPCIHLLWGLLQGWVWLLANSKPSNPKASSLNPKPLNPKPLNPKPSNSKALIPKP